MEKDQEVETVREELLKEELERSIDEEEEVEEGITEETEPSSNTDLLQEEDFYRLLLKGPIPSNLVFLFTMQIKSLTPLEVIFIVK